MESVAINWALRNRDLSSLSMKHIGIAVHMQQSKCRANIPPIEDPLAVIFHRAVGETLLTLQEAPYQVSKLVHWWRWSQYSEDLSYRGTSNLYYSIIWWMNIRKYLLKLFWCELQGIRYIGIRALTTHMIFKLLLTWYPATSHHQGHQATQASPLNVPSWAVLVKARCGDFYPVSQTMERDKDGELAKVITWFEVEMIFFFWIS
jgi:hypothetical protein